MFGRSLVVFPTLFLAAALGCGVGPSKPRQLFYFDDTDLSGAKDAYALDEEPLQGKDATYEVPARRYLYYVDNHYSAHHETVHDPVYGPYHASSESYSEAYFPSPYFLSRSDDKVLPEGSSLPVFEVDAERSALPEEGGVVWVRASIRAPAVAGARENPLNLALVLDLSSSMADPAKLELLRRSVGFLVSQLLPDDQIAVIALDGNPRVVVPAGKPDAGAIMEQVLELGPGPGANPGAALHAAFAEAEEAGARSGAPGHVVLISDGNLPPGSLWRSLDLVRQRHAVGERLSVIAIGSDAQAGPLAGLAGAGEGRLAFVGEPGEVGPALSRLMEATLAVYATNVRLRLVGDRTAVLGVHGLGGLAARQGAKELVLADLVAGETRNLLLRVRVPPVRGKGDRREIDLRLFFEQLSPVRRTHLQRTLAFPVGSGASRAPVIEAHVGLAEALEELERALEDGDETSTRRVVQVLERDFSRYKAIARAQGDRELIEAARLFEEVAGELRIALREGAGSEERARLLRKLYRASY